MPRKRPRPRIAHEVRPKRLGTGVQRVPGTRGECARGVVALKDRQPATRPEDAHRLCEQRCRSWHMTERGKELLDLPHYRTLIEQDLSRTFGDTLRVTTTVWPGPARPRRRGAFNPTPA